MSDLQLHFEQPDYQVPRAFFAYPSALFAGSEAIREAVEQINKSHLVSIQTWEDLQVTGKNIIQEICRAIDSAQIFCADLTSLNPNVMFELGYAVGRNKRIWLIFDSSFVNFREQFEQFRLLTTTGYARYTNSDNIVAAFHKDKPYSNEETLFGQIIEPILSGVDEQLVLHLKARHDTNASIRISKDLLSSGIPIIVDDPKETSVQPIAWYGQKIYSSIGVVGHLQNPAREGTQLVNSKYAFVCGLGCGMGRPVLMLAEAEYVTPIDYRDLLYNYKSAIEASKYLKQWLAPIEKDYREKALQKDAHAGALRLRVDLRDFYVQIGEFLAENEPSTLENYYIETTPYREALAGSRQLFVGRKGTGKTANMLALASEIQTDRDNVVVILQPVGYEIESLVRLFKSYRERDTKGYVIESLWKFLLLTEIANATYSYIDQQPAWVQRGESEKTLMDLLDGNDGTLKGDFSVRLERSVAALLETGHSESVEQQRKGISEALHDGALGTLRAALGEVLSHKNRVAILVDNLDKAWIRNSDIEQMSEFLLGLFTAGGQLLTDFRRKDSRRKAVNCTAAIFLRADIFSKVLERAREPDKIVVTRLIWDDPEILSSIVERRFIAAHPKANSGAELWSRYFPDPVKGKSAKDYILSRILPRPRDVVYLVKTAISNAVNRSHQHVKPIDVTDAEYIYSRYAMESILVENSITIPQLEVVLYEFAGSPAVVTYAQLTSILEKSRIPQEKYEAVIQHLVWLSFLGLEIGRDEFVFSDDLKEYRKNFVLAQRIAGSPEQGRFRVHPAFCAFLEISEA